MLKRTTSWRLPVALFACMAVAAALSLDRMEYLPALLIIAPGYVVQAWLLERHHALGGIGYQATMIGASAAFWTLVVLGLTAVGRFVLRRLSRRPSA